MNIRKFLLPLMLIITAGCTSDRPSKSIDIPDMEFKYNDYNINANLDWSQRWYTHSESLNYVDNFAHDAENIVLSYYNNQYYYHPFNIANHGLFYLNSYRINHDQRYLDRVNSYCEKLAVLGDRYHGGIYAPYPFNYALHDGQTNDVMVAPWYSGFAQGLVLSLYSRTYEITGDDTMKSLADSVFNTFLYMDSSSNAWITFVDSAGYYWIEEYPFHPPNHVFNGFMAAIIGLHDYYHISHDSRCLMLFRGACTTIAHYAGHWRVPGGISHYDLRFSFQYADYHSLVTALLRHLTLLTNDPYFNAFADTLYSDYH